MFIFFIAMIIQRGLLMNRWEADNADSLGVALKEAGFQTSQLCCSRPSCFDFAARKGNEVILVELQSDVDTFSRFDSQELRVIAGHVSAAPLVVSDRTHDRQLEDDTVYSRYSVYVVTGKTLRSIASRTGFPLVNAGPGGYFVEVNGALIESRRKELGLSIGKLAEMVGVSRRTLYGYERCMAKASVSSAYNLAKVLGVPVAKPVNVLRGTRRQRVCLLSRARQVIAGNVLLQRVFRKFAFCDIAAVRKAPFDFVMSVPEMECVIVGAVVAEDEKYSDARTEEILSVSRVINAYPVLITEKRAACRGDVLCVCADELAVMRSPIDLVACI
jgi:putative transcriptional regulator